MQCSFDSSRREYRGVGMWGRGGGGGDQDARRVCVRLSPLAFSPSGLAMKRYLLFALLCSGSTLVGLFRATLVLLYLTLPCFTVCTLTLLSLIYLRCSTLPSPYSTLLQPLLYSTLTLLYVTLL